MRAAGDVEEVVGRLRREGATTTPIYAPEGKPELAISPRDAFLGRTEVVATSAAAGRISSESIAGYPPGIPAILPGERVTEAIVDLPARERRRRAAPARRERPGVRDDARRRRGRLTLKVTRG